jgi:hypothetical protein
MLKYLYVRRLILSVSPILDRDRLGIPFLALRLAATEQKYRSISVGNIPDGADPMDLILLCSHVSEYFGRNARTPEISIFKVPDL